MAEAFELDVYLPYRLSVAANRVSRLIATAYERRFDLTMPEWRVMAVLGDRDRMTQQELVARTAMDKVTVSRAVHGLARRQLVDREPHGRDGRSHYVSLTDAGRGTYDQVVPLVMDLEQRLFAEFGDGDRRRLEDLARRTEAAAAALLDQV